MTAREHPPRSSANPRTSGSRQLTDPVWATVAALVAEREAARPGATLEVVDVGGGSGALAVQIAARGHRVTVVDPSPNALATLERRADDAGVADRIVAVQGDTGGLADIVPAGGAQLVLCHGVLEVVDDPAEAIGQVAAVAAGGAPVSVVVAGRHGAAAGRVLAGHVSEALAILRSLHGTYGGSDPLPRRFTAEEVVDLLAGAGLTVRRVRGVRTFGDLVGSGTTDGAPDPADVATVDDVVADQPAFLALAAAVHVVADRQEGAT